MRTLGLLSIRRNPTNINVILICLGDKQLIKMVSTDPEIPKTLANDVNQRAGLPAEEYKIVAWDMDTTGRRLIDEFCHIAGYTPEQQFSQYVMPYKDLDPYSKRRHLVKTMTVGRYRQLKDLKTGKVSTF